MQLIPATRKNIGSLLGQCNVPYQVIPFDDALYQECIDDSIRRGYPVDGDASVRTFLREGVMYGATAGGHIPDRPTQIWIALYTSCTIYVDDVAERFPEVMPDVYLFNDRFIRKEPQGSGVLDALADIIRRAPDFYKPVAHHLITTATLSFVAANILEFETKTMKVSNAAERYPTYQRTLSGLAEAYSFMVFPWEIPLTNYVQAIPDITLFIHNANDVLSFYKEELIGETTNQVSTLAARANKSKLDTHAELTETTVSIYKGIVKILEESPEACEAFKSYAAGYIYFHTSSTKRYRLGDLEM